MVKCKRVLYPSMALSMAMGLSVPAKAEIQRLMNKDALIAHYTFDKDVNDITGNVEPIDGLALKEVLKGKHGGALRFDGKAPLEIPIDLSADILPEFTVSMWVKADRPPTDEETRKTLSTSMVIASNLLSISNWKSDTPSFYAGVPGAKVSSSQHRVRPGQWTHVVITRKIEDRPNSKDETVPHIVTRLFSGGRMTESIGPYKGHKHAPSIYLGGSSAKGSVNNFVGLIDDLKIYKVAADEAQIGLLKVSEQTSKRPGQNIDDPTSKATRQIEQTVRGDEIMGDGIGNKGSEGDVDIPFESPIRDSPIGSGQSPVEALKDAARKNTSSISLPKETLPDPIGLPTGDVSAENTGTPPLVPGGFGKSPKSIDTSPSDQSSTSTNNTELDTSSIGSQEPTPIGGQGPALETGPLDKAEEVSLAKATADWAITGIELASEGERQNLVSGEMVTLVAIVRRNDRANKIPEASLLVTASTGRGPAVTHRIPTLRQSGDGLSAKYTFQLEVPTLDKDGKPAGQTIYKNGKPEIPKTLMDLKGKIQFKGSDGQLDSQSGNNNFADIFEINVQHIATKTAAASPASDDCAASAKTNEDGTRTTKACLESTKEKTIRYFVDPNGLLVHTNVTASGPDNSGTNHEKIFSAPIKRLSFYEDSDKVCKLDIDIKRSETDISLNHRMSVCSNSNRATDRISVGARDGRAITGLRICRNSRNRRMKGIEIETRPINADGSLGGNKKIERGRYPNCGTNWTAWSYCPEGTVAAGVIAYVRDGERLAPQRYFNTVNLMCGQLQVRQK